MSTTELLAIIGAIGSAVAITWNFLRELRDRGNLKIRAFIGKKHLDITNRDYLYITVTNIGRRPIYVLNWGVQRKNSFKVFGTLLRMLKESEWIADITDDLSILSPDLKYIFVMDATKKAWKISRKNIKNLFKEVKKLKSANKE